MPRTTRRPAAGPRVPSPQGGDAQLALDGAGNALIAFLGGSAGNLSFRALRCVASTGSWGAEQIVTPVPRVYDEAAMAIDRDGNALLAWTDPAGVNGIRFDAAAGAWSGIEPIESEMVQALNVAAGAGSFVVTWSTPFSSVVKPFFRVRQYASATGSWTPMLTLSDNGHWGDVVMDALGNATAVWNARGGAVPSIQSARFAGGAGTWSGVATLSSSATVGALTNRFYGERPEGGLGSDSAGNVRIAWQFDWTGGRVVQTSVWPAGAALPTGPPSAPRNLQATVSGTTVGLTWSPPTSGAAPTDYTLVGRLAVGVP